MNQPSNVASSHFSTPTPPSRRPKALSGFDHINRYWDKRHNTHAAKIAPGEFYVTDSEEMIVTTLGSCIAACIWDPETGVGGMNHFMLPTKNAYTTPTDKKKNFFDLESTRYGNWAMEYLINEILKNGGTKANLQLKVFGGGRVLSGMNNYDVGENNIQFLKQFIANEQLNVVAHDLGGECPRKVLFYPSTGVARVRKLTQVKNDTIATREKLYSAELAQKPSQGEIELF